MLLGTNQGVGCHQKTLYGMGLDYLWGQLSLIAVYSSRESETELNRVGQNY